MELTVEQSGTRGGALVLFRGEEGEKKLEHDLYTSDARPPVYLPLTTLSDFASFHNPPSISTPPYTRIVFCLLLLFYLVLLPGSLGNTIRDSHCSIVPRFHSSTVPPA